VRLQVDQVARRDRGGRPRDRRLLGRARLRRRCLGRWIQRPQRRAARGRARPVNASVDVVAEAPATGDAVVRFDGVERALHWVNAVVVLTLIATGSVMYIGSLSALVGRRELVEQIHLWSGLALPVPFV